MTVWDASEPDSTFAGVRPLLERLRGGDAAARNELLGLTYERLRRLAAAQLRRSFPRLAGRHEPESVAHDAWLRLHSALGGAAIPPTPAEFFRFAAHKIRQVLLDLASRQDRGGLPADDTPEPSEDTLDPARLAVWTEFHTLAGELPDDQRAVFDLHYYLGLPQREVAALLGKHEKAVSRLWLAATQRLADRLPDPGSRRD
jgi:RNA polymerase sigma factor (sigma-70 family)